MTGLVEIGKLYEKIDKNGQTYFVGGCNDEAGFIILPVRQRGQIGEAKFKLYVRSRMAKMKNLEKEEKKANKEKKWKLSQ